DKDYIYMLIGMVGTTIAPWMQFYLQSAVVEKGITAKEYAASRVEVSVGCLMTDVVAFFIIVACAGAIYSVHPRDIGSAAEAAVGLKPFGQYAFLLFSAGLFNASIFAACILPLSTAYTVCEGLGFESGVNRRMREAPIFYSLYTLLIVVGAGVILIPNFPLIRMILLSQVLNGVLLPFVLIYMVLLINKKDLMGVWTNPRWFNLVAWVTVVVMIGLTLALVGISLRGSPYSLGRPPSRAGLQACRFCASVGPRGGAPWRDITGVISQNAVSGQFPITPLYFAKRGHFYFAATGAKGQKGKSGKSGKSERCQECPGKVPGVVATPGRGIRCSSRCRATSGATRHPYPSGRLVWWPGVCPRTAGTTSFEPGTDRAGGAADRSGSFCLEPAKGRRDPGSREGPR